MTKNDSIIITDDGEVIDQSSLIPASDGASLKELIPYNRMGNIAKSTLTRLIWDKKNGIWTCSMGEFSELLIIPMAASELYAVWSEQVGKPLYYGVSKEEAQLAGNPEKGYRLAFVEKVIGPAYTDLFGLCLDFGEAVCKIGNLDKNATILVKGSNIVTTSFGPFYVPKIAR